MPDGISREMDLNLTDMSQSLPRKKEKDPITIVADLGHHVFRLWGHPVSTSLRNTLLGIFLKNMKYSLRGR